MSAKDSITTQTYELLKEVFNDFLTPYLIPFEYRVILLKSNQTVFDAPPSYVGLYTYSFYLENLKLPLTEFFCKVLEYFQDDAPFLTASDDDEGLLDVLKLKDATACHLKISAITPPSWKNHLVNHMDVELLDIYDRYYARQAVVDNGINRRSHELLQVIEKLRGKFDVIRGREKDREEECEGLRVKCKAAMTEFEKNPAVVALREKIYALSTEVTSLEAEKARLEAVEVSLRKEVEELKQDRLVSSAILYRMCRAYEQASNDFATATFPWLDEFVEDPSTSIEVLLSKKASSLQRLALENQPLSVSLLIYLEKHDYVERIPSGDENPIRTLGDYLKPSHEGYKNTIELPIRNNVDPNQHLKDFLKLVDSLDLDGANRKRMRLRLFQFSLQDQASNWLERLPEGSITTWGDLTTHFLTQFFPPGRTAKLRNDILMDFAKPVKVIALPEDVPSTSDCRLIKFENQVQCLMEAHLAPTQPTQVNKITTLCEIYSGPHDTQYCMENPEQAFVEYASSRTDEVGGKWYTFKPEKNSIDDTYNPSWKSHPNLSDSRDDRIDENEEEETDYPENIHVNPPTPPNPSISFITEKVLILISF
nr:MAK10-like protein [Tanacetum cinerariifolium]